MARSLIFILECLGWIGHFGRREDQSDIEAHFIAVSHVVGHVFLSDFIGHVENMRGFTAAYLLNASALVVLPMQTFALLGFQQLAHLPPLNRRIGRRCNLCDTLVARLDIGSFDSLHRLLIEFVRALHVVDWICCVNLPMNRLCKL